jgi:hypothetical protein
MLDARGEESHAPQPADARKRGRPVKPITGYGPYAQLARRMRHVRDGDNTPSYQAMGHRVNSNPTTLSKADTGAPVSWEHCELYLRSVGVDASALPGWRADHDDTARRAALFHAGLTDVTSRSALRARLRAVVAAESVTRQDLRTRRADAERHDVPAELPSPVPAADRLQARRLPPRRWTDEEMLWLLYLAGGTADDVAQWQARLADLPAEPPLWRDPGVVRAAVLGVLVIVVLTGGAYVLVRTGGDSSGRTSVAASGGSPGEALTPVPPAQPGADAGGSAAAELDAIIAAVGSQPPAAGRTAHVDIAITTYGPAPAYRGVVSEITEELDWSPDAPGRRVVHGSGVAPTPQPLPAGPPLGAAGPPSADPAELQRLLEQRRRSGGGTAALLLGVADLCVSHPLHPPERVAVLRMLRAAPGLTFQGQTIVERLGVPGKAFRADSPGGTRETLVFDPATGRLLLHETSIQHQDGTPAATRRVIYLRSSWDAQPD